MIIRHQRRAGGGGVHGATSVVIRVIANDAIAQVVQQERVILRRPIEFELQLGVVILPATEGGESVSSTIPGTVPAVIRSLLRHTPAMIFGIVAFDGEDRSMVPIDEFELVAVTLDVFLRVPVLAVGIEEYIVCKKGIVMQRSLDWKEIDTEYALFLDDDMELAPDAVERMFKGLIENHGDCIATDVFGNYKSSPLRKIAMFMHSYSLPHFDQNWNIKMRRSGGYSYNNHPNRDILPTQSAPFPCFLIKMPAYHAIHFEDERWLDTLKGNSFDGTLHTGDDSKFVYTALSLNKLAFAWYALMLVCVLALLWGIFFVVRSVIERKREVNAILDTTALPAGDAAEAVEALPVAEAAPVAEALPVAEEVTAALPEESAAALQEEPSESNETDQNEEPV